MMETPNYSQILINYLERKKYTTTNQKHISCEGLYEEIQKPQHKGGSRLLQKLSEDELAKILEALKSAGKIVRINSGEDTLFPTIEYAVRKIPLNDKKRDIYSRLRKLGFDLQNP